MFNFYVILAGYDMITEAGRATTCTRKFKAQWLQTKVQILKDLSKKYVLTGKQFQDFRPKKNRNIILDLSKNPVGQQDHKAIKWISPL